MNLTISRAVAILAAAVIPTVMLATRADAMCRCRMIYKQGYGNVYLCCDENGICAYYENMQFQC